MQSMVYLASFGLSSHYLLFQIAGKTLMNEKEYGLAISYYASAEDWPGLGRVVDRVLDEYVTQGPAKFARLVAEIAPSLQTLRTSASSSNYSLNGIFLHRLVFIVRYAEFHQRRMSNDLVEAAADLVGMFEEDVVPSQWWGVLLYDSVDLLNYREQTPVTTWLRFLNIFLFCSGWNAFLVIRCFHTSSKNGRSPYKGFSRFR